jgi:hypothetical protein
MFRIMPSSKVKQNKKALISTICSTAKEQDIKQQQKYIISTTNNHNLLYNQMEILLNFRKDTKDISVTNARSNKKHAHSYHKICTLPGLLLTPILLFRITRSEDRLVNFLTLDHNLHHQHKL